MHEHELESLLKETLTRHAKAHLDKIADLEYAIVEELPDRRRTSTVRSPWRLGLALAGAIVLFAGGVWAGLNLTNAAPCADPQVLCLVYPEAQGKVSLVGRLTQWERWDMNRASNGIWWIRLPSNLEPGRYEYGFMIDGIRWVYDPRATEFVHTFDGKINSVMYVLPQGEQQ